MISRYSHLGTGIVAGLAAVWVAACSTEDAREAAPLQPQSQSQEESSVTPKPIADLVLSNGNTLEFYDFGSGVLVSELGKAGITPTLDSHKPPEALEKSPSAGDKLKALWQSVAPDQEMPASLRNIQTRWANSGLMPPAMSKPRVSPVFSGIPFESRMSSPNLLPKAAAPVGCNNGCCDEAWLRTLSQCNLHLDYSWFLFNYGYSYANTNGVDWFRGLVCSANGTSSWKVNVSDGSGGTWSIPQAHYRTYYWIAGLIDRDVRSSVNTSSNQALHTYCGSVSY